MRMDERIEAHPDFKKLYNVYLLIPSIIVFIAVIVPSLTAVILYTPYPTNILVSAIILSPFLLVVGFTAYWIPKYCSSIVYEFQEDKILVERGVWWKHKKAVPYNRITNIDVVQGPISRRYGLGKVSVQTAGYSGTSGGSSTAEISILGVKKFEEIKEFILEQVGETRPIAVEAAAEKQAPQKPQDQMLKELKKIRELLEKQNNR